MGNFTGVRNKYFYIDLTPITEAEIGDIPDYEYAPGKEFNRTNRHTERCYFKERC